MIFVSLISVLLPYGDIKALIAHELYRGPDLI